MQIELSALEAVVSQHRADEIFPQLSLISGDFSKIEESLKTTQSLLEGSDAK